MSRGLNDIVACIDKWLKKNSRMDFGYLRISDINDFVGRKVSVSDLWNAIEFVNTDGFDVDVFVPQDTRDEPRIRALTERPFRRFT